VVSRGFINGLAPLGIWLVVQDEVVFYQKKIELA
jgi:hypothetical protein